MSAACLSPSMLRTMWRPLVSSRGKQVISLVGLAPSHLRAVLPYLHPSWRGLPPLCRRRCAHVHAQCDCAWRHVGDLTRWRHFPATAGSFRHRWVGIFKGRLCLPLLPWTSDWWNTCFYFHPVSAPRLPPYILGIPSLMFTHNYPSFSRYTVLGLTVLYFQCSATNCCSHSALLPMLPSFYLQVIYCLCPTTSTAPLHTSVRTSVPGKQLGFFSPQYIIFPLFSCMRLYFWSIHCIVLWLYY